MPTQRYARRQCMPLLQLEHINHVLSTVYWNLVVIATRGLGACLFLVIVDRGGVEDKLDGGGGADDSAGMLLVAFPIMGLVCR